MSERKGTKALELWCKRLVKNCPNVQIENMTTSWRDGIAFCALVHHFRPDLIDLSTLKPENVYENNQLAFNIAEKHLGIPALLDPEDMVNNEVPDRLSILTYLSQFYQRLGHTVNTKTAESEPKLSTPSPTQSNVPVMFGKTGLDKCAACGLPVYLAQRLIVSHKLYHRRCFRCTKCSGQFNPKNFEVVEGSDFCCDSCKNEKSVPICLNNNDQMGMLAFCDDMKEPEKKNTEESVSLKQRVRPQSILDKINMFENNTEKDSNIVTKLDNLSLKDNVSNKYKEISTSSNLSKASGIHPVSSYHNSETDGSLTDAKDNLKDHETVTNKDASEKGYKSNLNKLFFLQTQLSVDSTIDPEKSNNDDKDVVVASNNEDHDKNVQEIEETANNTCSGNVLNDESNITDDIRLAKSRNTSPSSEVPLENNELSEIDQTKTISVPPRRKKIQSSPTKPSESGKVTDSVNAVTDCKQYPDHLNPFSEDEDEEEYDKTQDAQKRVSTNPFGSSDEEDDEVPPMPPPKSAISQSTPGKRVITAPYNPFWSDGEEPSSDDGSNERMSDTYKSSLTTSTPNLPSVTPRRKKAPAPPPPIISVEPHLDPCTSMDDVASISSLSSYNSTVHSDQKSYGKITPRLNKKRLAPTPPDSLSTVSFGASMEIGMDSAGILNTSDGSSRRLKGPAPGLPLPERREVKLQMSPDELQIQLDMLETQQLGLERQGVLIEQMIRDKCEGDEATAASVPQEEVEDLVIQLCELVNEKNDLFRKQTELMYIRRQQRLEQEQADIEHEIRVIQSRPAVNRIDSDKAREEQLVSRLVQIVRMRDELVQQIDAERRRERQEDIAIATSIASKRAQRNSESKSASLTSGDVTATPKKSKVKDKVKKQLKKAKNSIIHKKKYETHDKKEEKIEKKSK